LRDWVKAADSRNGTGSEVVAPEAMALCQQRAQAARLKRENEVTTNAAACFARDVL
jgi:transposase-like protein